MAVVYGVRTSRVAKVLWALREVGAPFSRVERPTAELRADPHFLELNPKGTVPVATFELGGGGGHGGGDSAADGAAQLVLNESNTIASYVCARWSAGTTMYPPTHEAVALAWQWLEWGESSVQPTLSPVYSGLVQESGYPRGSALQLSTGADGTPSVVNGREVSAVLTVWAALEAQLRRAGPFVLGDSLSMADLTAGVHARRLFALESAGVPASRSLPRTHEWYLRLCERPAYAESVLAGGGA